MSQKSNLPKKLKFPGFLRRYLCCCVLCRRRNFHKEGAAIPNQHAIDGYSGNGVNSGGNGVQQSKGVNCRSKCGTPVDSDSSNFDEKFVFCRIIIIILKQVIVFLLNLYYCRLVLRLYQVIKITFDRYFIFLFISLKYFVGFL